MAAGALWGRAGPCLGSAAAGGQPHLQWLLDGRRLGAPLLAIGGLLGALNKIEGAPPRENWRRASSTLTVHKGPLPRQRALHYHRPAIDPCASVFLDIRHCLYNAIGTLKAPEVCSRGRKGDGRTTTCGRPLFSQAGFRRVIGAYRLWLTPTACRSVQTPRKQMRVSSLSRVVGTAPPCGHHPSRLQAKAHSVRCSSSPGRRDVLRSTASVLMAAALPSAAEELPLVPRADLAPGLSISRVSR